MDEYANLTDYIRANLHLYTRAALDERLRAAGYTDAEIEAAWEEAFAEPMGTGAQRDGPPVSSPGGNAALVLVIITAAVVGGALWVLTMLGFGLGSSGRRPIAALTWFVNLGFLVVVAGLIAGGIWLARRRGWSTGQIAGLVAGVALVWYLIVAGSCFYGTGAF